MICFLRRAIFPVTYVLHWAPELLLLKQTGVTDLPALGAFNESSLSHDRLARGVHCRRPPGCSSSLWAGRETRYRPPDDPEACRTSCVHGFAGGMFAGGCSGKEEAGSAAAQDRCASQEARGRGSRSQQAGPEGCREAASPGSSPSEAGDAKGHPCGAGSFNDHRDVPTRAAARGTGQGDANREIGDSRPPAGHGGSGCAGNGRRPATVCFNRAGHPYRGSGRRQIVSAVRGNSGDLHPVHS
jgi:hypothetical protein